MTKDTGGAAFPYESFNEQREAAGYAQIIAKGMSLRDYFAAMVVQGVLSNQTIINSLAAIAEDKNLDKSELIAQLSYIHADAMLKERNK